MFNISWVQFLLLFSWIRYLTFTFRRLFRFLLESLFCVYFLKAVPVSMGVFPMCAIPISAGIVTLCSLFKVNSCFHEIRCSIHTFWNGFVILTLLYSLTLTSKEMLNLKSYAVRHFNTYISSEQDNSAKLSNPFFSFVNETVVIVDSHALMAQEFPQSDSVGSNICNNM